MFYDKMAVDMSRWALFGERHIIVLTAREGVEEGAEERSTSAEVVEAGVRWADWELHTASLAVAGRPRHSWWQFHFGMVRTVVHKVQRWEERQLQLEGACRQG